MRLSAMLYVLVMVVIIVGVDYAFLRGRFFERLAVNVGIVLLFGIIYLMFFRHR